MNDTGLAASRSRHSRLAKEVRSNPRPNLLAGFVTCRRSPSSPPLSTVGMAMFVRFAPPPPLPGPGPGPGAPTPASVLSTRQNLVLCFDGTSNTFSSHVSASLLGKK